MSARVCSDPQPSSLEEVDNLQRSTKKIKGNENPPATTLKPTTDVTMEDPDSSHSYKDSLMNVFGESSNEGEF